MTVASNKPMKRTVEISFLGRVTYVICCRYRLSTFANIAIEAIKDKEN